MKSNMKKRSKLSDTALIKMYQSGTKEVLTFLVERWHVRFCKLAYWYCKDKDIAKDIAQESWVVIFNKLNDLKQPDKFKSWAISIVNRKSIDWIRKTTREQKKLDQLYYEASKEKVNEEASFTQVSIHIKLKEEIEKLPKHQQIVLQLFYVESYSLKQIANVLEISIGTTKSRLFHARERLKRTLKNTNSSL